MEPSANGNVEYTSTLLVLTGSKQGCSSEALGGYSDPLFSLEASKVVDEPE